MRPVGYIKIFEADEKEDDDGARYFLASQVSSVSASLDRDKTPEAAPVQSVQ
jgi:hypothetical protein